MILVGFKIYKNDKKMLNMINSRTSVSNKMFYNPETFLLTVAVGQ